MNNPRPAILVIFGITGDLAQRKLLPALYRVLRDDLLPTKVQIVGITRRDTTPAEVVNSVRPHLQHTEQNIDQVALDQLQAMISLYQMELTDDTAYQQLLQHLHGIERGFSQPTDRLYYLSIPPQVFLPVVRRLGEQGHHQSLQTDGAVRLLVEKPFGYDLESAQELIAALSQHFAEEQIFRIDHYLAKETAQNILTFRFQNPIFEAVWNSEHIDHIQIVASERLGIEGRNAFYEQTGALRDFVQSHLLQLLALTTMERPERLQSQDIHAAKLALLQSVEPIPPNKVQEQALRGQYQGYRSEVGKDDSWVETFAALRLHLLGSRWQGTPVFLCTGKQLAAKTTEITVAFRANAHEAPANRLIFRVQPDEGITLELQAKQPGFTSATQPVDMHFDYHTAFAHRQPDAYERVLVDAFRGDRTLFATSDEVLASWRIVQAVVEEWAKNDASLALYQPGSWGPQLLPDFAAGVELAWPPRTA